MAAVRDTGDLVARLQALAEAILDVMTHGATVDKLVGASPATAARVIGVAERRLRRWRQNDLIVPSRSGRIGEREHFMYGVEDLVQGRVVAVLERRGVPIRQIATIVRAIRSADQPRPLASLRWATTGGEAFVEFADGEWYGGRRPHQSVIPEVLDLEEIRTEVRRRLPRPEALAGRIVRKRGVQGSREIFEGTRVPVETVIRYLQAGRDDRSILESFPTLLPGDIDAARSVMAAS